MAETARSQVAGFGERSDLEDQLAGFARSISGYYDAIEDETRSRDELITWAVEEGGFSQGVVARAAGLSRARVHQILARG